MIAIWTSRSAVHLSTSRGISFVVLETKRLLSVTSKSSSGHNRWSKIRHRKGAADAQKSALFSRLSNEIHSALRSPQSHDPISNDRLASALQKAKEAGLPKDVIEKCFTRARQAADGSGQIVVYEALGPSGKEAMMIETMTENPSRTVQRIKEILHKHNCRIAPVSYLFERKGVMIVDILKGGNYDELFELALEGGAEEVKQAEEDGPDTYEARKPEDPQISTPPPVLSALSTTFSASELSNKYDIRSSDQVYQPIEPLSSTNEAVSPAEQNTGEDQVDDLEKVISVLEMESDVVKVWSNFA